MNGTPARRPKSAFSETGVRIKEVSDGRPCENCPELCPGFIGHAWRKTCKSCGCDRLKHSVYHEELCSVRDRLGLRDSRVNHHSYDSPPGLTAKQTELYWNALAERAPTCVGGATGQAAWRAWRTKALATQLPKQDLSLAHCRHVDDAHRKQYEDFVAARNEIALDIGLASQHHGASVECMGCNKPIRSGNITIQAPRIGEDALFHPACFVCAECDEVLVELAYCALDARLYCLRHYSERLKPRCHACDELFKSCPSVQIAASNPFLLDFEEHRPTPLEVNSFCKMGLLLSVVISYAGVHEAYECVRHILSGVIPDSQPDFQDLVEYYTTLLRKSANQSRDWTGDAEGYLCLTQDKNGKLRSAAVKYYNTSGKPDSTALLFSTKISSFGQESFEENSIGNGDFRTDRYTPTKTKTIVSSSSDSFSVRHRSPVTTSIKRSEEQTTEKEKLTWLYQPQSPTQEPPEIHFQSYDDDKPATYSEDFLRSLDGIKFRPLQRSDPSGRRRSFKKRNSSSSTSSKESRASREEELRMFTSLEEAEFERMNKGENFSGFGSAPNLSARSYSRSRSRERKSEHWSVEASVDSSVGDDADLKRRSVEKTKLDSLEEPKDKEVIEEEEEVDFWGNMGD